MIRVDRRFIRLVEFLYQRENKAWIAFQLRDKVAAACSNKLRSLRFSKQTAVFKGVADLLVQLIAVGQYHDGGRPGKLATDLLREEYHGIALAGALGVPEHAQLAIVELPRFVCLDRFVDAKVLMVTGKDFYGVAAGVIIEDKVLQQIEEILLFADATQHSFQSHAALLFFIKALPFMEEFIFASQRADLGLGAVGEHEKCIIVEQMRYRILIIRIVVIVSVLHVYGVFL